jgi:hypothetical protein
MKFHFGSIPDSHDFKPEEQGWVPLREPTPWIAQLMALPVAVITGLLLLFFWFFFTPLAQRVASPSGLVLGWIPITVILHELMHALFHPGFGTTGESILGFWPQKLLLYAHYTGAVSRQRFVWILLAPFLVLSIFPLLVCMITEQATLSLFFVSLFNGLLACMDLLGTVLILIQVPYQAIARNKTWRTYYRVPREDALPDD